MGGDNGKGKRKKGRKKRGLRRSSLLITRTVGEDFVQREWRKAARYSQRINYCSWRVQENLTKEKRVEWLNGREEKEMADRSVILSGDGNDSKVEKRRRGNPLGRTW